MARCLRLLVIVVLTLHIALHLDAHNDHAPPPDCHRPDNIRLQAAFLPGLITVDGISSDWDSVVGLTFVPLHAIQPDPDPYPHGSLDVKVAHDGHDVFFLLEFQGPYVYTQGKKHNCPSVGLMFGIGDDATYNNMGGCKEDKDACSSLSCKGYEVDLVHFSTHVAVPGQLYGGNIYDNTNGTGRDSLGSLNDMYAWNPHCRNIDGLFLNGSKISSSGAQNDWQGAWSHSSMDLTYGLTSADSPYSSSRAEGKFVFEFSRPLRTTDHFQQDVQFTIGHTFRFMAGFWYPENNVAWAGYEHYTASCDWIPLEVLLSTYYPKAEHSHQFSFLNAFTLMFSMIALCISALLFWRTRSKRLVPFQAIDGL